MEVVVFFSLLDGFLRFPFSVSWGWIPFEGRSSLQGVLLRYFVSSCISSSKVSAVLSL